MLELELHLEVQYREHQEKQRSFRDGITEVAGSCSKSRRGARRTEVLVYFLGSRTSVMKAQLKPQEGDSPKDGFLV